MTTRRRQLALVALVGLLVVTAGCSALGGGSKTTLLLANDDDTSHDVTVEITKDGSQVYRDSANVGAETDAELASFSKSGEYTVLVTVDGRTTRLSYEFESGGTVSIGVGNDGNVFMGG
ncbi:MAG: hypothetical protein ABEJ88_07490 [Halobacterium sp.]